MGTTIIRSRAAADLAELRSRSPATSSPPATPTGTRPARPGTSRSTSSPPRSSLAETRRRRRRDRRASPARDGLRVAPQGTGHDAGALGDARRTRSCSRPSACAASTIDPRRAHAPASRPARSGSRSPRPPPSTASPRSPAPRPTSASSATRSAAASAGSPASTASPPTSVTRDRARHRRRRARPRRPRRTSPTCSGRCAAAAAASASSPRSSSTCSRSPRSTPAIALVPGRARAPRCCTRGATGPTTRAGRDHLRRPHPPVPADPRDPGAAARQVVRRRRGASIVGDEADGGRADRAAARARAR